MKNNPVLWLVAIVVVVLLMGVSFWGGTYYERQARAARFSQFANMSPEQRQQAWQQFGQGGQQGNGARPQGQRTPTLTGKVDQVSSDAVTITTRMGSLKVLLSSDTKVSKAADAKQADIVKGSEIFVQGTRNDSGNIEASKIIIITP